MPGAPVTAEDERPRVGRPARINRQMIAEAAHDLGLDGLTLRAVADHLGVSIAALYHHVSSKDDLMRAAAEYSATRVPLPEDRGQHWAVWLVEWATYSRTAFLAQPGLLTQYLEGAVSAESIAGNIDTILGHLVRQGFTILEADAAYGLVTSCALGSAVNVIREKEAEAAGRSMLATHEAVLAAHTPDELTHLRLLIAEARAHGRRAFDEQIATVIRGIAADRGLEWAPIAAVLADAAPAPRSKGKARR
ncbi:MAG TPA: helix-turn-helix domain-containing protein [Iamia sp.]|nr:helix-turn-helix domain-containing protein [Iamia sp.]